MDYKLIACLAAAPLAMAFQQYMLVLQMSKPEEMMGPVAGGLDQREMDAIARHADWLKSVNLEFRTSFQFGTARIAIFQEGDQPRFFTFTYPPPITVSYHGARIHDIKQGVQFGAESYLADLTVLDTSSSGNPRMLPRPGAFRQNFYRAPAEEVWGRHLEGEQHLSSKFGYEWAPLGKTYEELFTAAIKVRMAYTRTQLLWPFRILLRYFVTGRMKGNKTIAEQFPL